MVSLTSEMRWLAASQTRGINKCVEAVQKMGRHVCQQHLMWRMVSVTSEMM